MDVYVRSSILSGCATNAHATLCTVRTAKVAARLRRVGAHGEEALASLDELIDQFQQAIDQIDQAITSVSAGEDDAGEMQSQFSALGAEDKASQLAGIKDGADSWRTQLQGAVDTGNHLIEQVKAAKG